MQELKHLEFLADNSKEIVEKQVDSYRQQHSYAGTIIGVTVLFIPFFLSNLDDSFKVIQFISIFPIALFIWAILLMLGIFKINPLDQAFSLEKYQDLLNKTYEEILLSEIKANLNSFNENKKITVKGNKRYLFGVRLIIIAIVFSIVLILVTKIIKIEKVPTKVELIDTSKITNSNSIKQTKEK